MSDCLAFVSTAGWYRDVSLSCMTHLQECFARLRCCSERRDWTLSSRIFGATNTAYCAGKADERLQQLTSALEAEKALAWRFLGDAVGCVGCGRSPDALLLVESAVPLRVGMGSPWRAVHCCTATCGERRASQGWNGLALEGSPLLHMQQRALPDSPAPDSAPPPPPLKSQNLRLKAPF